MPSLHWVINWEWGVYTIDRTSAEALTSAIQPRVLGKKIGVGNIGLTFERLTAYVQNSPVSFSAVLEQIDPIVGFQVDRNTDFYFRLDDSSNESVSSPGVNGAVAPPVGTGFEDFVMWQRMFDPSRPDPHYMAIYDSLVGIRKEDILEEMAGLLMPLEAKQQWSLCFYGQQLPILRSVASQAPVIVFGGDPGTGKTALATSIGAPLARMLRERVHFRHMSLLMRGMGYHGRASSMIVKSFDHIKGEGGKLREPMILFFDEAEAIVGSRNLEDTSSGARQDIAIVDSVIVGVDSLRKGSQARVIALFATNLTEHIDPALMRRCYYHQFERPDDQIRRELLESSLRGLNFSSYDLERLVVATRPKWVGGVEVPFTHSDIVEQIIARALDRAIQANEPLTIEAILDCCQQALPTRFLR